MKVTTTGFKEALLMMKDMKLAVQRPILKRALATAAAPIVFRAKRNANQFKDSSLLADSIGVAVKVDRAGHALADIRPYGGKVVVEQTEPDGKKNQRTTRASAYAHIIEFGSKHVHAHPFMRPALDGGLAEAKAGFVAEVRSGLERIEKKAARAKKKK